MHNEAKCRMMGFGSSPFPDERGPEHLVFVLPLKHQRRLFHFDIHSQTSQTTYSFSPEAVNWCRICHRFAATATASVKLAKVGINLARVEQTVSPAAAQLAFEIERASHHGMPPLKSTNDDEGDGKHSAYPHILGGFTVTVHSPAHSTAYRFAGCCWYQLLVSNNHSLATFTPVRAMLEGLTWGFHPGV